MTLVSTRHSPRQLPLRPYSLPDALSAVEITIGAARISDWLECPSGRYSEGASLGFTRDGTPQFPLHPYTGGHETNRSNQLRIREFLVVC
jgi:hypothetical protein